MRTLVGYTGFVGSNLTKAARFDNWYNSKNIKDAFGLKPDILYYAGVPAQKYIANKEPEKDIDVIENAMSNIEKINPKSIVLISTVDVYKYTVGVDENTIINPNEVEPYGKHRYVLEQFVSSNYKDHTIIRLPGLFGKNIKKNFIYDMIHFIPSMISASKMAELDFMRIQMSYKALDNGFYQLKHIDKKDRQSLIEYFEESGFSALSFTDSRSTFQFYDLSNLFDLIETVRSAGIRLLNVATEPCEAGELYRYIFNKDFINILDKEPANYDMRTIYANTLGGLYGYLEGKADVMKEIKEFVMKSQKELGK